MNEKTNKAIEESLKANRHVRYDEIGEIMSTVDKLTEWPENNMAGRQYQEEDKPLKQLFMKEFNIPVWVMVAISIVMYVIGKYT